MQDSKCWNLLLDPQGAARREGSQCLGALLQKQKGAFSRCVVLVISLFWCHWESPELSDNEICRVCLSNLLGSVSFPILSRTLSREAVLDSTRPSLNSTLDIAAAGAAPSWPVCPWRSESFFPDAWYCFLLITLIFLFVIKPAHFYGRQNWKPCGRKILNEIHNSLILLGAAINISLKGYGDVCVPHSGLL